MINKNVTLLLEDSCLQVEYSPDTDMCVLRLNDFEIDEEISTPGFTHHKQKVVLEIYPTVAELKEIIKALQNVLPEMEVGA